MERYLVLWEDLVDGGIERCVLTGRELRGTVLLPVDDVPTELRYVVRLDDAWPTRHVEVERHGRDETRLVIDVDDDGRWSVDGLHRGDLDGCVDVDLELSPSTNMLPLRRLDLDVGASAEVEAAWVRFPSLRVEHSSQTYTRFESDRYQYRSGDFTAEITVGPGGLVRDYGRIWRQVAASGAP